MIKSVLDLLIIDNHYSISERVEFAKGSHELPRTIKDFWIKLKRRLRYGR